MVALACLVGIVAVGLGIFLVTTPRPNAGETDIRGCMTTKMFSVRLCPSEPGYVKLNQISIHARNAVIVSEDAGFYHHGGFDWAELKASFETNLEKGQFARGGSTITQQLAKNVYLSQEKSILRKAREALITLQIEDTLKKDEILEKYLNVVEFGENIYGINKASRHYFKKAPSQLTPAEGAFLAFLLPNPKGYAVSFHKKRLTKFANRQISEIIDRLRRFKKISEEEYSSAMMQSMALFGGGEPAISIDPSLEEQLEQSEEGLSADPSELPPEETTDSSDPMEEFERDTAI